MKTKRRQDRPHTLHETVRNIIILSTLVCVLLGVFGIQYLTGVYNEEFYRQQYRIAGGVYAQIENVMSSAVRLSMQVIADTDMQTNMACICDSRPATYGYSTARSELQDELTLLGQEKTKYVAQLSLADKHGNLYHTPRAIPSLVPQIPEMIACCPDDGSAAWFGAEGAPYLVLVRAVREAKNLSLRNMGYVLVFIDAQAMLAGSSEKDGSGFADSTELLLDGNVVARGANAPAVSWIPNESVPYERVRIDGNHYLASAADFFSGRIRVVHYTDLNHATMAARMTLLFILVLLVAVILLTLLFSLRRVRKSFQRLDELTDVVKEARNGDFDIRLDPKLTGAEDEVGALAQCFQLLMDRIDELVNRELKKQLYMTQAECRMLQAQIRPHFLYNTLESINAMAVRDGNKEISRITMSLSRLVRASYRGDMYVPLSTEIGFVQEYLKIYRIRFGSRLKVRIEYDPACDDILIPQMTLQPLVENSIRYGLMKKEGDGVILLRVRHAGSQLRICVFDNGVGFPPELIEKYRNMSLETETELHGHANVFCRLRYTYGEDAQLDVRSREGRWTNMAILIPDRIPSERRKAEHV